MLILVVVQCRRIQNLFASTRREEHLFFICLNLIELFHNIRFERNNEYTVFTTIANFDIIIIHPQTNHQEKIMSQKCCDVFFFNRDVNSTLLKAGRPPIKHTFDIWHMVKVIDKFVLF